MNQGSRRPSEACLGATLSSGDGRFASKARVSNPDRIERRRYRIVKIRGRGGVDDTNQVFLFRTGVCPGERPGAGAAEGRGSTIGTAQPQPQHFTVSAGSDAA